MSFYSILKVTFVGATLEINQFYSSSNYETYLKWEGRTNIWKGTNILISFTNILVPCWLLWKIRDCHCMINVKITFVWGILQINHLKISSASQNFWKLLEELIYEAAKILQTPRYWFIIHYIELLVWYNPTRFFCKSKTGVAY